MKDFFPLARDGTSACRDPSIWRWVLENKWSLQYNLLSPFSVGWWTTTTITKQQQQQGVTKSYILGEITSSSLSFLLRKNKNCLILGLGKIMSHVWKDWRKIIVGTHPPSAQEFTTSNVKKEFFTTKQSFFKMVKLKYLLSIRFCSVSFPSQFDFISQGGNWKGCWREKISVHLTLGLDKATEPLIKLGTPWHILTHLVN